MNTIGKILNLSKIDNFLKQTKKLNLILAMFSGISVRIVLFQLLSIAV